MKKTKVIIIVLFTAIMIVAMCIFPEKVITGAKSGMFLCANAVVPSLFPFMFFVTWLIKSCNFNFGKTGTVLSVYILSAIGGYPVGARLIDGLYERGRINRRTAHIMQCFCFNAGPGFIILTVGCSIMGNTATGVLLYIAHIISSFILGLCFYKKIKIITLQTQNDTLLPQNTFCESAAEASLAVINICAYIVVFSVVIKLLSSIKAKAIKNISLLFEISNAVGNTKNIYYLSFLLGFGCFCVWFQVLSVSKNCGVDYSKFAIARIAHGLLSAIITRFMLYITGIQITTAAYSGNISRLSTYNGLFLSISMLIMLVVLFLSISVKNKGGNLIDDIV